MTDQTAGPGHETDAILKMIEAEFSAADLPPRLRNLTARLQAALDARETAAMGTAPVTPATVAGRPEN